MLIGLKRKRNKRNKRSKRSARCAARQREPVLTHRKE